MKLQAWYRTLLFAFPAHYRRARGEEMLGTLLDSAAPGQARPTIRQAAIVITSGIRCRVRLRPGPSTRIAAAAATLAGAILTATLFSWAAWSLMAPALPSQTQADAIAREVIAQEPLKQYRFDFVFGDDGRDLGAEGRVEYRYGTLTGSALTAATETLRASGWAVDGLVAVKGDVRLELNSYSLRVTRTQPAAVPWMTAIGALLGAYVSWMLTARVSRRLALRATSRGSLNDGYVLMKAATITVTGITFFALFPPAFYAGMGLIQAAEYGYGAPWALLTWAPLSVLTAAGIAGAVVIVAFNELPVPDGTEWNAKSVRQ